MMPLGNFVESGTTPKPLPIGRVGRLLFGAGTGFYFAWNIMRHSAFVSPDIPIRTRTRGCVIPKNQERDPRGRDRSVRWSRTTDRERRAQQGDGVG